MRQLIKVPFLGANDKVCVLTKLLVANGTYVKSGATVGIVETTKSAVDVDADFDGFVYINVGEGEILEEGDVLGLLSSIELNDIEDELQSLKQEETKSESSEPRFTKKAEILITRHKLNSAEILAKFGQLTITEDLVVSFLKEQSVEEKRRGFLSVERVGVIGGASGGGALIVIDSIMRNPKQQAVAVFDSDAKFHGKKILGVPVVGNIDTLAEWVANSELDGVVIAFNRNLSERKSVYEELKRKGIVFTNVIDPSADIRSSVQIGDGNVILGGVYIGACSSIGNNNFLSANVSLEHGNSLGSHCAFGPVVATSGNVTIGDTVRFGTGIYIEPDVTIGSGAIVASGSILRSNVPAESVVKMKYSQSISPKE